MGARRGKLRPADRRRAAARKGWQTRRARARARSEAARKGWRTRREREATEAPRGSRYRDLDDWIETWEDYDGDYDYWDIETSADY